MSKYEDWYRIVGRNGKNVADGYFIVRTTEDVDDVTQILAVLRTLLPEPEEQIGCDVVPGGTDALRALAA